MKSNLTVVPVIDNAIYIEHYLFLYSTPSFIQDLTNRLLTIDRFTRDIHQLKNLWIKPLNNSDYFEILLPQSILLCSLNNNRIELNAIYEKSIRNHAQFIKDGIAIGLNKEIVLIHQNSISNKQLEKNCRQEEIFMENTISSIITLLTSVEDCKKNIETEINHKMYELEFENWLGFYDQSALQHHESNIISQPQIKYKKIAVDQLFGPFTLLFYIDSILPIPLKHGQALYIKSSHNAWISGTMHDRYSDNNMSVMVVQFEQLFTINDFKQQGDIFIFFNKDSLENKSFQLYYSQLQPSNVLKALFSNQLHTTLDTTQIKMPLHIQSKYHLDDEQYKIAHEALGSKQLYYINGAVTTGKTKIISSILEYYEAENKRVLHITPHEISVNSSTLEYATNLNEKIADLRASTLTAIDSFESRIIEDKNIITAFVSDALDLTLAEEEHKKLSQYLDTFYAEFNHNYLKPLKRLYSNYIENENLLNSLYMKLIRDEKKIIQQMSKNEFSKWVILPVLLRTQSRFKRNYLRFLDIQKQQQIISAEYNDFAIKVKTILSDEQIVFKKEMWLVQSEHIKNLKSRLSQPFELLTVKYSSLYKDSENIGEQILKISNQLESLHLAYKEYRQKISAFDDRVFFMLFIKERISMHVTIQKLHEHFSLFINEFDIVLIDDAHALTVVELFLAISLGNKAIIAGDTNQLSINTLNKDYLQDIYMSMPVIYTKSAALALSNLLPVSLKGQLSYLYRVMPNLTTIFNTSLISEESRLRNKTEVKLLTLMPNISNPVLFLTTSRTQARHENEILGHGIYNHCEANAIINLVVSILDATNQSDAVRPEDILITSFFTMQVEYIRSHLSYAIPTMSKQIIDNMVKPIFACTGMERKVVLVSLCVSNKKKTSNRDLLNLRNPNLWNIALSRATHQLILIGDVDYIKTTISNEQRLNQTVNDQYEWTSFEVALMMKTLIKTASEGEIQFISLSNFMKSTMLVNGGIGNE